MQRTVLWDQAFDGILAYIASVRPEMPERRFFGGANSNHQDIKTQIEYEIWSIFETAFQSLKTDARAEVCGEYKLARQAISMRNTEVAKTLNITAPVKDEDEAPNAPDFTDKTVDDRFAFSLIEDLMRDATQDFLETRQGLIDGMNAARRRDMGIESDSVKLQDSFKTAKNRKNILGTDLHREMALSVKETVNAYRRIHNDLQEQISKVSPYSTFKPHTDKMAKPPKPAGRIIL